MSTGSLYAAGDGGAARLARAIAWIWRLGPVLSRPDAAAVGLGGRADLGELARLLDGGDLAGAVVFAPEAEAPRADERFLALDADPDRAWGTVEIAAILEAVSAHLLARLERPLVLLPAIGMLRVDDFPGNAQQQLEGRAKPDWRQRRRLRRYIRTLRRQRATLNVALPSQALRDGQRVPLDEVWKGSVAELRKGARAGAIEPVCHGMLHLDTERLAGGEIEFREFARLDELEAGERIDSARAWQASVIGEGETFVAPAWAYSEGAIKALERRRIPFFVRCEAGAVFTPGRLHETLDSGAGIKRLDYRPVAKLASLGLPPTLVLHGTLLDGRRTGLRLPRDLPTLARLAISRDLIRLSRLKGIEWVGAAEYGRILELHDRIEVSGDEVLAPDPARVRVRDRDGIRPLQAG